MSKKTVSYRNLKTGSLTGVNVELAQNLLFRDSTGFGIASPPQDTGYGNVKANC